MSRLYNTLFAICDRGGYKLQDGNREESSGEDEQLLRPVSAVNQVKVQYHEVPHLTLITSSKKYNSPGSGLELSWFCFSLDA